MSVTRVDGDERFENHKPDLSSGEQVGGPAPVPAVMGGEGLTYIFTVFVPDRGGRHNKADRLDSIARFQ